MDDDDRERFAPGPSLDLPGFRVRPLKLLKYLEIIFDPKLSFEAHVDHLEAKCSKRLAIFNALAVSTWGIGTLDLRMIYVGTVLPQFLYCASAWYQPKGGLHHGHHRQRYLKFLKQVQKRAAVRISGAFRTSGADELDVELNLLPVELQLEKALDISLTRMAAGLAWEFITSFRTTYGTPRSTAYYKGSPLQKLEDSFKRKFGTSIINSERILPVVCPPW